MSKKILARLFIKPEFRQAFKEHAKTIICKTREEKGCLFYNLLEDVLSPGEFMFHEEYADQVAMEAHLNSAYLQDFREIVGPMQTKEKIVEII